MHMTDRRIYAACLSSYNNGCLHGAWIDAEQDADSVNAAINKMLKASPYPNVTRQDWQCNECGHDWTRDVSPYQASDQASLGRQPTQCPECTAINIEHNGPAYPSAEEFAIHDHEGFGALIGEYTPVDELVQIAEALEEHGDKYAVLRSCGYGHAEAIKKLEEDYQGEYDSLEDWAEQFLDDTGLFNRLDPNSPLKSYFDYERYARDAQLGGDIMTVEGDGRTVHVFWNH
jgi:antirestriction protein